MNQYQARVRQFHHGMGQTIGRTPALRDNELRAKLIYEEAMETIKALGCEASDEDGVMCGWYTPNEVEVIDGLCDLLYVVFGTAVAMGVDLDPFFAEVHKTNMAKLAGPVREDGKRLKPEGWQPPDIEGLLEKARRWAEDPAEARHEALLWNPL